MSGAETLDRSPMILAAVAAGRPLAAAATVRRRMGAGV
jgi:hypothetical protein